VGGKDNPPADYVTAAAFLKISHALMTATNVYFEDSEVSLPTSPKAFKPHPLNQAQSSTSPSLSVPSSS